MMVVRDNGDMMQESSTELDIDDHVSCSTQIGASEEIGSGSANGVEEEEGTSTLDCRA